MLFGMKIAVNSKVTTKLTSKVTKSSATQLTMVKCVAFLYFVSQAKLFE
jgi:hypothetical protein